MTTHNMRLRPEPFALIVAGTKTIEGRLCDEKRRLVRPGDEIRFTNTDTSETVVTRVVGLLWYASFLDMFTHQSPRYFGFEEGGDARAAAAMMRQYYSEADELKYGVLGIQIEGTVGR